VQRPRTKDTASTHS